MSADLTFITNEENQTLKQRFQILIKDTRFFDCIVGYFYTSGFFSIYKSLEKTEKIRILIGIGTSGETVSLINNEQEDNYQKEVQFSHAEAKKEFQGYIEKEFEDSDDKPEVESGVQKFVEWIRNGKLEIRAYPTRKLHAKVYIMTFTEGDRDTGRVITGSSNFTQAGLSDNLEFNVELKNRADYEFARKKFEELWQDAVDVSESYISTVEEKTWLNQNITPYQLYLKFLYEYFREELSQPEEIYLYEMPSGFKKLEYQEQAVLNAKKILEEYGGVFISDVVGLGKTYIAAMLAKQLDGRTLVIAPPSLLQRSNPGSWVNVMAEFNVPFDSQSIGKLEEILESGTERYKNIIIDEAHRFRTETTQSYEILANICRGKRVILVTATPYNNTPQDVLNQIKLFQKARRSTIPNMPDLEGFFKSLEHKLNGLDRQTDYKKYISIVKENANEIREKVLKYLMVRRTRTEITKYFSEDLKKQKIKFPEPQKPEPLFYELDDEENKIFDETIELITRHFRYARYTPMLYYKGSITQPMEISQRNMGRFMKILLVKRLESSFYAFSKSVDRFLHSYEMFIKEFEKGNVWVSKKYSNKIFELLEDDDDEAIQKLIEQDKAQKYSSDEFREEFIVDLRNDYEVLKRIKQLWQNIRRDPKLLKFIEELKSNKILRDNKIIVFTESKETAGYLEKNINEMFNGTALLFTGSSGEAVREKVIENFDARARNPKDEYRLLVSTEVLAEGVNLHRANTVVNYDIPWNPVRMIQRVGRINRVDTKFSEIYTFNFFPTKQSNDQIQLKEVAESKINAFLTLLGGDAALLTEGEPIGSHELFNRLISKQYISGEDESEESELKYLQVIKEIRDKSPDLFNKVKHLPRKARTAKSSNEYNHALLTYFRKGKLDKFFISESETQIKELDFLTAARLLESTPEEEKKKIDQGFYKLLDINKEAFRMATTEEAVEPLKKRGGRDRSVKILRILKAVKNNTRQLTDEQEEYLRKVIKVLEEGGLTGKTLKDTLNALQNLGENITNPLKVIATLQTKIPSRFFESHYAEQPLQGEGKREVILSVYFNNE
ncbi:MAG: helicase-related protein [Bacteroidales bacterium]